MANNLPLFIDPETLSQVADESNTQIVAVEGEAEFAAGHIPGAARIDLGRIVAAQAPIHGLLPDAQAIAEALSDAGLRNDATIIAYDRSGDAQAARFVYTLAAMGHQQFGLLDGGLEAWLQSGLGTESGPAHHAPTDFQVSRSPETIANRDWIESHLDNDTMRALDVRSADEYAGRDVRSARGGHVPGAAHLDWQDLKDSNGRLKPAADIEALLTARGLSPDQEIVTYCQSHMRSSYAYLVLRALGYQHVRGYPGAWSDWGNCDDTPVESGDPARG